MANNNRDISLRIRAQTEGLSELQRAAKALEVLEQSQREFGQSAGTAGRSLGQLENELRELNRTAKSLDGLNTLQQNFRRQLTDLRENRLALSRARDALAGYEKSLEGVKRKSREQSDALQQYRKTVRELEKDQKRLSTATQQTFEKIRTAGAFGAGQQIEQLRRQNAAAVAAARQNINEFDQRLTREKQITAELERQRQVVRARINAERQVRSGFGQFSQNAETVNARNRLQRNLEARGITADQKRELDERTRAERKAAEESDRLERQKTAALKREIQKRIDALRRERETGGGNFGRFSRNVAAIDAGAAEANAARIAVLNQAEAYKRLSAIERAWQSVTGRTPPLANASASAIQRVGSATNQTAAPARQVADGLGAVEQALRRTAGQGRTTLDFFQRLRGQVLELVATYGSLFSAITLVQQAIQNDITRTGVENRLLFANQNDAQQTASDLAFVRDVADDLGQSFTNLATLYSRFTVASQAANVEVETTRSTFRGLSEAFTVLGLSQDDVAGSFRAIEQSISKSTVQAEELRGQLGDRFPGAATTFARAIGVTTIELNKFLEAGRVSSTAWEFFAEEVSRQARATLPRAANSLQSSLNRLRTAWEDFTVAISRGGLGEQIGALSRELAAFFRSSDGQAFARGLSDAFSLVVTAVRSLLPFVDQLILAFQVFIGILAGRVLAAGIAGLIAGFRALVPLFVTARAAIFGTAAATTVAAGGFTALAGALGPLSIILGIVGVLATDWALKAADSARQTAEFEKEMQNLRNATGDTRTELIALNAQRLDRLKAEIASLTDEAKAAEQAIADATAAANKAAQRQLQQSPTSVGRFGFDPSVTRAQGEANRAQRELDRINSELEDKRSQQARAEAEQQAAITRTVEEANALRTKVISDAKALELQTNRDGNAELLRQNDETYNEYARRTKQLADDLQTILNAEEVTGQEVLSPAVRANLEGVIDLAQRARREARQVIRPGTATNDRSAQRDADRQRREIEQLQEASNRERERSLRDSLQRLTEDEATAAEARVELIRLEYAQKIAEQQKFQQQATALRQSELAAQFGANIGALEQERDVVIAAEQRRTAIENVRKEYERLNTTVERLQERRDAEIAAINEREAAGLISTETARQQVYETNLRYQDELRTRIDDLIAFLEANRGNADLAEFLNIDAAIIGLQGVKQNLVGLSPAQQEGVRLAREFTNGLTESFTAFGAGIANAIKGVGSFGDAFKGALTSFREFLANFLVGIGQAIAQAALFRALFGDDGTGGLLGGITGGLGRLIVPGRHRGGIVGYSAPTFTRSVPAAIFSNAVRYHSGGIAGLKPDEVPTILQTGEEVLARNDPRNRLNGGAAPGGANVQIVNAIDAESVVAAGMQGNAGRQIIMNVIQANKAAFRQVLAS
jgi:tape measure domain-containing protein